MTKTKTDDDKLERLASHSSALSSVAATSKTLGELRAATAEAELAHALALAEAERLYGEAYAEEVLADVQAAELNVQKHEQLHTDHCHRIHRRRAERLKANGAEPDHRAVKLFTVDGSTHDVIASHELMLGCHGFIGAQAAGSRYIAGCGISVDARHDELDHERFDQTATLNCSGCETAIAAMDAGEIEDKRTEYLTSKEQIAHQRAVQRRENQNSNR